MVTRTTALGPQLDRLPDTMERSLVGNSIYQVVIVILDTCLNPSRRRAGLPWFVGNLLTLIVIARLCRESDPPPRHPLVGRAPGVYPPSSRSR